MAFNHNQGEFNFDSKNGEKGYLHWQEELDRQKKAIESRWNIVLSHPVRVVIREYTQPIEGIISVISEKTMANKPPRLRIGHMEFSAHDIESIVRLEK